MERKWSVTFAILLGLALAAGILASTAIGRAAPESNAAPKDALDEDFAGASLRHEAQLPPRSPAPVWLAPIDRGLPKPASGEFTHWQGPGSEQVVRANFARHAGIRPQSSAIETAVSPVAAPNGFTILVNTTSPVIDGDTLSIADLLANPGSDGKISLPEAIKASNNTGPGNLIKFDPTALSPSAVITVPVNTTWEIRAAFTTLDGDLNGDTLPDVAIVPSSKTLSISVLSSNNTIRYLAIRGLGLLEPTSHSNRIHDCYLGPDLSGFGSYDLENNGIEIREGAHHNTVEYNLIAGNTGPDPNFASVGVFIWAGAHDNSVRGNRIGVGELGLALPNEYGVVIGNAPFSSGGETWGEVTGNVIGVGFGSQRQSTVCDGACNQISGNQTIGVLIYGTKAVTNTLAGNFIGVNLLGTTALANAQNGVYISAGARGNRVGGDRGDSTECEGACNLISGNGESGVLLSEAQTNGNFIEGNFIGTNISGTLAIPNQGRGVLVAGGASGNRLGGGRGNLPCVGVCNLISGNHLDGVTILGGMGNQIQGNYIGVNAQGAALGNQQNGVLIGDGARQSQVGGVDSDRFFGCSGNCNLIGGNKLYGVALVGSLTMSNTVQGNYIGVDVAGEWPVSNMGGVFISQGAHGNRVGGSRSSVLCTQGCNLVSGNSTFGVALSGAGVSNNVLEGNFIGSDRTGKNSLGNLETGVFILGGASRNRIGGPRPAGACRESCNLIRGNQRGVIVLGADSVRNTIQANSIFENQQLGIDLGGDGLTFNDPLDQDAGANDLMNFPGRLSAEYDNGQTVLRGIISVTLPASATVDVYAYASISANDNGEGQSYLGSVHPNTNGEFSLSLPGKLPMPYVVASATNSRGSTSEFMLADTDGDSLYDAWEKFGLLIPGTPEVYINLPGMGASPGHKDLFVHADWMEDAGNPSLGLRPSIIDQFRIISSFAMAPLKNPDGKAGVNMHLDLGPDSIMNPETGQSWGTLSRAGAVPYANTIGWFDTVTQVFDWTAVDSLKGLRFAPAQRKAVFHYMCFCSNLGNLGSTSGISRIDPKSRSTDFLVTLASWSPAGGTSSAKIGTFIHELGHGLGLIHGGVDQVNQKPNYQSVMNYMYQAVGLQYADGRREFDYSRKALPTLNENSLIEGIGISDADGRHAFWSPLTGACASNPNSYYTSLVYPALDWNCDGAMTAGPQKVEINRTACIASGSDGTLETTAHPNDIVFEGRIFAGANWVCDSTAASTDSQVFTPGTLLQPDTLVGAEDWSRVRFDQGAVGRVDGSASLFRATDSRPIVGQQEPATLTPLSDDNDYASLRALVPPEVFDADLFAPVDVVSTGPRVSYGAIEVSFDGSGSYDADGGNIVSFEWDFGDGATATGMFSGHTYAQPGVYFASLKVVDDDGRRNLSPDRVRITVHHLLGDVRLEPEIVVSGNQSSGLVELAGPAPAMGAVITLTTDNPAVIVSPSVLEFFEGDTQAFFTVETSGVSQESEVTVIAESQGITDSVKLTILPATLESISVSSALCAPPISNTSPIRLMGGHPVTLTVSLSGLAPLDLGAVVSLDSSDPDVAPTPAGVIITGGAHSADFRLELSNVTAERVVTISAQMGSLRRSIDLLVFPALNYPVINLGAFTATALNNQRQVIGWREDTPGETRSVRWENYQLTDLGVISLPGYSTAYLVDINDNGEATGTASNGSQTQAFRYLNGAVTALPLPQGYDRSYAVRLNNAGQIIGTMTRNNPYLQRGFVWDAQLSELPPLAGFMHSWAHDINDSGVVVGNSVVAAGLYLDTQASRWINGAVDDPFGLPSSGTNEALALNESGQSALIFPGRFGGSSFHTPFLWSVGSGLVEIPGQFTPTRMNDQGVVIGEYRFVAPDTGEQTIYPVIHKDGLTYNAACYVAPGTGINITAAVDLNESGDILALGSANGQAVSLLIALSAPSQSQNKVFLPLMVRK